MKNISYIFCLAIIIPSLGYGQGHESHSAGKSQTGVTDLSPGLRKLLSQEMRLIQKGMTDILPLYVSGKWTEIAVIASKIEASFVLKQKLSRKQRHELHKKLPGAFIELDQHFHYLSGMLAHAAKMEKPELVGFYFSKMNETCVGCHTRFATHKFPALAPKSRAHGH